MHIVTVYSGNVIVEVLDFTDVTLAETTAGEFQDAGFKVRLN